MMMKKRMIGGRIIHREVLLFLQIQVIITIILIVARKLKIYSEIQI